MIEICYDGVKLSRDNNRIGIYWIYVQNNLILSPEEIIHLKLPYKRKDYNDYYNFELSKNLALQNIKLVYSNLNEAESLTCIEIWLQNGNNKNMGQAWLLTDSNSVEIKKNSLLGKIFC
jgi:hypothetical protein